MVKPTYASTAGLNQDLLGIRSATFLNNLSNNLVQLSLNFFRQSPKLIRKIPPLNSLRVFGWSSFLARPFLYLVAFNLFMHHDRLGSAIQVRDDTGAEAMRLGYSPFGQVYRKHNDKTLWKINTGVNANKQLGQLIPYQYTGGYTGGVFFSLAELI